MSVRLLVHVEKVGDDATPPFVWWAESPDVPGFSAAEDYLPALIESCRRALAELRPGEDATFRLDVPPSATVTGAGDVSNERQTDLNPLVVSLVA